MYHIKMELLKNPSSWRKMSIATWQAPDDPTIYGRMEVDVTNLLKFIKEESEKHGVKITVTHCIAKGVALALKKYPQTNAIIRFGRLYLRKDINIFLQVAITSSKENPDLSGVCIKNADQKKVYEIAKELNERAKKVRDGTDSELAKTKKSLNMIPFFLFRPMLKLTGFLQYTLNLDLSILGLPKDPFGSVMVTSVGTLGIDEGFVPIVPISRVPILVCVGAIKDKVIVEDGKSVIKPICVLTGTFDHRVVDGVQCAYLSNFIKEYVTDPYKYEL